jgi:hypothetical protein
LPPHGKRSRYARTASDSRPFERKREPKKLGEYR